MTQRETGESRKRKRDKVKYQILCLSLMAQDPHGRERKPRSEQDMMNPETDNLRPPHSQPTHTYIHRNKKIKNSQKLTAQLRNQNCGFLSACVSCCHCICLFLCLCQHTMWHQCLIVDLQTCSPAVRVHNMSG